MHTTPSTASRVPARAAPIAPRSPRSGRRFALVAAVVAALLVLPAPGAFAAWSDVPNNHWAKVAIDYVAADRDWMRDYGASTFRPGTVETRLLLARAAVFAFDPSGTPDRAITFSDLPANDPLWRYANVAVKNGWLQPNGAGAFRPDGAMTLNTLYRTIVLGLGLTGAVAGLKAIHLADGTPVPHTQHFPYLQVGMTIGLRYNHPDEATDVLPGQALTRDEVAWALYRAATAPSWKLDEADRFAALTLPNMTATKLQMVVFGLKSVGYPYVYAGEWNVASPPGYCCGYQPQGGFDCSGLVWWVVRSPGGGYDNTAIRGYQGWSLPERSSSTMAAVGTHISWTAKAAGDLLFYTSPISHVDLYVGRGWALDSSSSRGGVALQWIVDGWYFDEFQWGRRLSPGPSSPYRGLPPENLLDGG